MASIEELCRLFYESEYIPLFLYRNGILTARFPETELPMEPPAQIRSRLKARNTDIAMAYSDASCLYFMVSCAEDSEVFGGPVPLIWIDADTLSLLMREYLITDSLAAPFADYMARIPPYNNIVIGKKLNQLHFLLTGQFRLSVSDDLLMESNSGSGFEPNAQKAELLYDSHSRDAYNNSYEVEEALKRFITEGDLEGYEAFVKSLPPMNTGTLAASGLRSFKNSMIISTALACRNAIAAGVPRETAYALSDAYIIEIERLDRMNDLLQLSSSVIREYIQQVRHIREASLPSDSIHNRLIRRCVNYIHRNLNRRLTVDDVARYVNLSRSYLSSTFKQCTGIPLNRFILDAKLDEATSLLEYTDRPVSDISDYLCFSSQSHFQQVFKEKYGMTPRSYRLQFLISQQK